MLTEETASSFLAPEVLFWLIMILTVFRGGFSNPEGEL